MAYVYSHANAVPMDALHKRVQYFAELLQQQLKELLSLVIQVFLDVYWV